MDRNLSLKATIKLWTSVIKLDAHTTRNFFKSFPDAISRRISRALLISILNADATPRTISLGRMTSGI